MLIWEILLVFPLLLLWRGLGEASLFLFYFFAQGFQWQLWSLGQIQHGSALLFSRCSLCFLHILSLSPNSFCWISGMPCNILYQLDIDFRLPSPRFTFAVTFLFCGLIKLLQRDRILPQCEVFTLISRDHSLERVPSLWDSSGFLRAVCDFLLPWSFSLAEMRICCNHTQMLGFATCWAGTALLFLNMSWGTNCSTVRSN